MSLNVITGINAVNMIYVHCMYIYTILSLYIYIYIVKIVYLLIFLGYKYITNSINMLRIELEDLLFSWFWSDWLLDSLFMLPGFYPSISYGFLVCDLYRGPSQVLGSQDNRWGWMEGYSFAEKRVLIGWATSFCRLSRSNWEQSPVWFQAIYWYYICCRTYLQSKTFFLTSPVPCMVHRTVEKEEEHDHLS